MAKKNEPDIAGHCYNHFSKMDVVVQTARMPN